MAEKTSYKFIEFFTEENIESHLLEPWSKIFDHFCDDPYLYDDYSVYQYMNTVYSVYICTDSFKPGPLRKLKVRELFDYLSATLDLSEEAVVDIFGASCYVMALYSPKKMELYTEIHTIIHRFANNSSYFEIWTRRIVEIFEKMTCIIHDKQNSLLEYYIQCQLADKHNLPKPDFPKDILPIDDDAIVVMWLKNKAILEEMGEQKMQEMYGFVDKNIQVETKLHTEIIKDIPMPPTAPSISQEVKETSTNIKTRFRYFTDKATQDHINMLRQACQHRYAGTKILALLVEWEGTITVVSGEDIIEVYQALKAFSAEFSEKFILEKSFTDAYARKLSDERETYCKIF
jgi:propanediol dehydratase small subunit